MSEREFTEWLVRYTAQAVQLKIEDIDITEPFTSLGLSSLDAVELVSQFNKTFSTNHSPTVLFDYPDIESLAAFLSGFNEEAARSDFVKNSTTEPIAVIGMGCRFPGSYGPDEFFNNLKKGQFEISKAPLSRFGLDENKAPWGGYLTNIEDFDASFFGIFPEEAKHMDPHQKVLLEVSWNALEHANIPPKSLANSRTGVFVGISNTDFPMAKQSSNMKTSVYDGTGSAHSIAANRLSYLLNLKGPSIAVDTACSSSLVAVHQACLSLRHFESNLALAGGVNVILGTEVTEAFTQAGMLSPEGKCKSFSDQADGYVRGEGAGVVILKRLSDAKRDGDRVLALIRGSAINQDGKTNGLTAPNGFSQQEVIQQALVDAEIPASKIDYIEAHGTGTPLGDPIEYKALKKTFSEKEESSLLLGSVKTNIGHLESAAGIAGLLKVIVSLNNETIPKLLHFDSINSKINTQNSPIKVASENVPWTKNREGRFAGVSSFGFGGTNSHVIVSDYLENQTGLSEFGTEPNIPYYFLPLSASSENGLKELAKRYISLIKEGRFSVEEICRTAMTRRSFLKHRLAVSGKSLDEISSTLASFVHGKKSSSFQYGKASNKAFKDIAFLYTGQGSQSPKMGLELYERAPIFRKKFNQVLELAQEHFEDDLFEIVFGDDEELNQKIYETNIGQVILLAFELSLTDLWRSYGVEPQKIIGHSLGEIIGACAFGMLPLKEAVEFVVARGNAMQNSEPGSMSLVYAKKADVKELIRSFKDSVSIAALNGPAMTMISGAKKSIEQIESLCEKEGLRFRALKVRQGFHSPLMDPVLDEFYNDIKDLQFSHPRIPVVSCLYGEYINENSLDADYWKKHLRKSTNFLKAMETLAQEEPDFYLEIGPHPTLIQLGSGIVSSKKSKWLTSINRKESNFKELYNSLGTLWVTGFEINMNELAPQSGRPHIELPLTPYDRKESWPFKLHSQKSEPAKGTNMPNVEIPSTNTILSSLKEMMAAEIDVDSSEIDVNEPLIDMGADSLVLMKCLDRIHEDYGVEISVADVFQDISSLEKMAGYISENSTPVEPQPKEEPAAQQTSPQTETASQPSLPVQNIQIPQGVQNSEVSNLIQQQLHVMSLQLQALGQAPGEQASPTPQAKTSPLTPAPKKSSSGKGVLGQFSNSRKASSEKIDDRKKEEYISNLINEFSLKTKKSKHLAENYRKDLADNRVSAGFRPNLKEMVYPISFDSAKGSRFTDVDGNNYVDYTMGFGVNLFGHSPEFIDSAIGAQLKKGIAVGPQSSLAGEVAHMICEMTGNERATFVNSGTEAIMTAIRLARAATGRETVVIFEGSYHGHADVVLGRTNSKGETLPVAPGIPKSLTDGLVVLEYGDEASLNWIKDNSSHLAAVLVEPVQSRYPDHQPVEFLKSVREITEQAGTAFIWDEVITGFRIAPGGAQEYFGIRGDITTYGKVIGGGLPIGVLAGKSKFLDFIDGGDWHFGDSSMPQSPITFFAGTFCKHPLAMTAARQTLIKIKSDGKKLFEDLNRRTGELANELNDFFKEVEAPLQITNFGSLFRFKFSGNMDWLFFALNNRGQYIWEGRNLFLSTAHTDEEVREFISTVKEVVLELIAIGYIPGKLTDQPDPTPASLGREKMILPQERFLNLQSNGPFGQTASQMAISLKLKGDLQTAALKDSILQSMREHESLSAQYDFTNSEVEFMSPKKQEVSIVDFSSLDNPELAMQGWLQDVASEPLETDKACVKISILKTANDEATISFIGHHAAVDGLSVAMLTDEIAKRYSLKTTGKSKKVPNSRSYRTYLQDYNERLDRLSEAEAYWEKKATKLAIPKALPTASDAPQFKGGRVGHTISAEDYKQIRNYGYKNNSTLLMTLFGSLNLFMKKEFSQEELTVGVPVMGHTSIKDYMVGNCSNIVPIECRLKGRETLTELVSDLKKETLEAFHHTDYPIQWVEKKAGRNLFDISLNVEPISDLPKFGELTAELTTHPINASEFPVILNAVKQNGGLFIEMDYQERYFSEDTAREFLTGYSKEILLQTKGDI